jgi:mono/diheme cytochrome c family protein
MQNEGSDTTLPGPGHKGTVLGAFALGLSLAWAGTSHGQSVVERGRYLATLGDCVICHTAPGDPTKPFAGGYPLHARFGTVYSTNITPDRQTGIGTWTPEQFYHAVHEGIGPGGQHLYPAFPYPYFATLSRADTDAIFAYLKTVKPIRRQPRPDALVFPANIRFGMTFWNALFYPQDHFRSDPSRAADWNRGGDLVHGIGHCGGCHSQKNFLFSDVGGKLLQGATADGWYAPDLTPGGLGNWSVSDIEDFLRNGYNRFGAVTGAMQEVVRQSTSQWTESDRHAVAVYLKSLPRSGRSPSQHPEPSSDAMAAGRAVFVERCAICHADTRDYPSLAHNAIVSARDPATIIRVVLQGSQSVPAPHGPIGFSMPAFPVLSDDDVAAVLTYIRNSWGSRAGPVTVKQVRAARAAATSG